MENLIADILLLSKLINILILYMGPLTPPKWCILRRKSRGIQFHCVYLIILVVKITYAWWSKAVSGCKIELMNTKFPAHGIILLRNLWFQACYAYAIHNFWKVSASPPHLHTLSILPSCPKESLWTALGELIVAPTVIPTRDHLPNSPYCTTHSWL